MRTNKGSLTRARLTWSNGGGKSTGDVNPPLPRRLALRVWRVLSALFFGGVIIAVSSSAQIAQVQHAPSVSGRIEGTVQQMTGEGVTFNSGAVVTGDLLVPGTPTVIINGTPTYSGTQDSTGATSPSGYSISLNSGASLRHVIRRTNAVALPTVATVPAPTSTASVTISTAGQTITWTNLKNLTLNSNVGQYTVPAGTYGNFSASSGTGFKLGIAGATQASVYNFQNLTLNGNSTLQVLGPVVINLANGFSANAPIGASTNPAWLMLNIKSGGFTLNSGCNLYGYLVAPAGTVIINAGTQLIGGVSSAYLTVNGNGLLKLQSAQAPNQSPTVSLTAPINGSSFQAPASFPLSTTASDSDGSIAKVEFFQGSTKIGQSTGAPFSWTVSSLAEGNYSFFARATDNLGATADSATKSISVTCANKLPVVALTAPAGGTTLNAPATITVSASASDADGTIARVDFYQGTVLLGSDSTSPYSINTSALPAGAYTFSAKAFDNSGGSTTSGNVSVTVTPMNQAPAVIITAPANNTVFDTPASFIVTATASDSDGTVAKVEFFRNGLLQGTSTQSPFQLAVTGLAIGAYDFVARAADNTNASTNSATVHVNVAHINDAPVATAQSRSTLEDTPIILTLAGSDSDGDPLSYSIVAQPGHGTLTPGAQSNNFTYSPAANFSGDDVFTFKVSDGSLESPPASVQLAVTPVNDAPVAGAASFVLNENSSTSFVLAGADVDSDSLVYAVTSGPSHGTYSGSPPNLIYTPVIDYSGSDSLGYTVSDGQLTSAPTTISFTINHVNRAPAVALTAPVSGARYIAPANFNLKADASDIDGAIAKVEFFQNGTKIGETTVASYDFSMTALDVGSYSYVARATDNSGATTDSAAVAIVVVANTPPGIVLTAPADGGTAIVPAVVTLAASASDSDGAIARVEFYQGATLLGQSTTIPYSFSTSVLAAGTYTFSAIAFDNLSASTNSSSATVTVVNPNQAPTVVLTAPSNGAQFIAPATVAFTATASDSDGLIAKVEFFNGSTKIGESVTSPYQFTWNDVAAGNYTLTARATDNTGAATESSAITITMIANTPPTVALTAPADGAVFTPATSISLNAVAADSDGSVSKVEFFTGITKIGEALTAPYQFVWNNVPPGTYVLTARATDNLNSTATSEPVTVTVNAPPIANPQALETPAATALAITLSGSDPEAQALLFVVATQPVHGALSGSVPNVTYTPNTDYIGSDSFTFKVNDGFADSAIATISITVNAAVPQAPHITSHPDLRLVLRSTTAHQTAAKFTPMELKPSDVGSDSQSVFTTLPTANPALFGFTGSDVRKVNFDVRPNGTPLVQGEILTNQYASLGVTFNSIPVRSDVFQGAASPPFTTFTTGSGARQVYTFHVPVVAVGVVNTSPDHDLFEFFSPDGTLLLSTADTSPTSQTDRFVGARVNDGNLIGSMVLVNTGGDDEMDELVFEVLSSQVLPGLYVYPVTATDSANLALTYSLVNGPVTMRIDPATGLLQWLAGGVDAGDHPVTVRVTNTLGLFDTQSYTLKVVINGRPQLTAGPDISVPPPGNSLVLRGVATDDDVPTVGGLTLQWARIFGPGSADFSNSAIAQPTVTISQPGIHVFKLTGTDGLEAVSDYMEVRVGMTYSAALPRDPAAWWPLNGTPVEAIHGNHDAQFIGNAAYDVGEVSMGVTLEGTKSFLSVPASADFDIGTSAAGLTIELWAKPGRTQNTPLVHWNNEANGGARGVALWQSSGGVGLLAELPDTSNQAHSLLADNMFTPGVWTHVAVTYDKTTGLMRLYRNGVMVREQQVGVFTPQTALPLFFGARVSDSRYYQGILDEVTLYRRALTQGELLAIYSAGAAGKSPVDDNAPPVVDAGPDVQVLGAAGTATLNGTVIDDGKPLGGALTMKWTKVEGPGHPVFANQNTDRTTATFTAPGTYVLRLDANDGLNQASGDTMVVRVGVTGSVEPPADIAAWWPANGDVHEVIHGNHDVEFVPRGVNFGPGEQGQGFVLNGVDEIGRVPPDADLDVGTSAAGLTIELWAKPSRAQDTPLVHWNNEANGGPRGAALWQYTSGVGLMAELPDTANQPHTLIANGVFTAGVWTHVAVTYDKTTGLMRLYRNGILVREQQVGVFTPRTALPLSFGARISDNRYYQGILDEVTLYRRALTQGELQAIYNAGVAGKSPVDDNAPPVVEAGPDVQVVSAAGTAMLNGTVTDDGKPLDGTLTMKWTKVEGPGEPVFANQNTDRTTATFTAPGTYVLRLDASDGLNQAIGDTMVVRIGVTGSVQVPADIAAWWPANGDVHEVIHGNHDVEFVPRGVNFGPGEQGQGFIFNGVDEIGRVSASADLDVGTSVAGLTIELWAKPSKAQDTPLVHWNNEANGGPRGAALWQYTGGVGLMAELPDTANQPHTLIANGVFTAGVWTHVAVTYDKTSGLMQLYRDGIKVGEQQVGVFTPQTTLPLLFGARISDNRYYQGALDEVTLYRRALTQGELLAIYNAGTAGKNLNFAPVANAGLDLSTNVGSSLALSGLATDDGRPNPPAALTYLWSKVSGPGNANFFPPTAALTSASFDTEGTYTLRLTANDSVLTGSDNVVVTVAAALPPPIISLTAPVDNASLIAGVPVTLSATATYSAGTITRVEFYDGAVKVGESTAPISGSSYEINLTGGLSAGAHILAARAIATGVSAVSEPVHLTATLVDPVIKIASPTDHSVLSASSPFLIKATASVSAGTLSKVEFFDGAVKLGERLAPDASGGSLYSLVVNSGSVAGGHALFAKATASTGASATSFPVNVTFLSAPLIPPILKLDEPVAGSEITAPTNLVGTISSQYLQSYEIQVRYKTPGNDGPWRTMVAGTASVPGGVLGQLDPSLLPNGMYEIRLTATDQLNVYSQQSPFAWISVTGGMKIGANTSTHTDLAVATGGLPLSIVRHYDSTDGRVGDFGVGTSLATKAFSVQVSQKLGEAWYAYTVSGFQGLPQYVIDPSPPIDATGIEPEPRIVSITLPDNTTFRFSARLTPNRTYTEISGGQIVFDAMPGTLGELVAVNEATFEVENDILSDSNFGFTDLINLDDGGPLDPKAYCLTTIDGTQYIVSSTKGVLRVTDRHGNSTSYSPNRIEQSNGAAIDLVRDGKGRITAVKDQSGQSVSYHYDSSGRLLTVTDREGRITTYGYLEGTSLMTSIQEPGAILPEYDAYDAVGRLISKVDGSLANGGTLTERDFAHRIEKHRDALNRMTSVEYDIFGNVVRRINALGSETKYVFADARFRDKPTTVTDAEGGITRYHYNPQGLADKVTDANGHATSYTYNATGQLLTETDALGRAMSQTYDSQGNLLTRTDRGGNTTSFTYDSSGNVLTEHSPLGNENRYTYNALGLPLTETEYAADNTPGRKRSYTYDANGKISSDTTYRSDSSSAEVAVTSSYSYAPNGQPTQTTYPDGTFSTKAYNDRGLLASETDRSGNVASYTYDNTGRLTRTTYADNSYEEKTYDAVGRMITERNALGQTATNTYDDADHLLSIDFPGVGAQSHTYDKVGRMLTDTDEGGRVTTTAYDPVGNVVKVTYSDGTSTDLLYDEVDDLKTASARVFFAPSSMDVGYDPIPAGVDLTAPNSLIPREDPTMVADGSKADSVFSRIAMPFGYRASPAKLALGRATTKHSIFGKRHAVLAQVSPTPPPTPEPHLYKYTYDANGRMTSITNPDGSPSSIEYDAVGRPIKTINELGQVWTYEYDLSSNDPARRMAVKGPLGYVERYLYDPSGDIAAAIDPLGNITEHHYNTAGQCTDISYSNSHGDMLSIEKFEDFDQEGNPQKITDREGFETTVKDGRTRNTKSGDRVLKRKVGFVDYITTETYNKAGNLEKVVDPRGAVTAHEYDFFNRRTSTTLPDGRKVQTVYGPRNRVDKVHEIASDGTDTHTTEYLYDNNDKVTQTIRSHKVATDSVTVDSQYLADGRAKMVSAPYLVGETPRNTSIDYDDVNRIVSISDPMGRVTVRKHDKLGRLVDDTDTAGTTTHRGYDDLNRLTSITVTGVPDPVTHVAVSAKTAMTYDAPGNLLSRTEAAGTADARTTSYTYEHKVGGSQVTTTYADSSTMKSFQDTRGLITSTTTPRGNIVTTKYDALGRPTLVTGPLGQQSDYTYPDLGERQVITDALGRTITRTFDLSQRVLEEKLPGSFGSRSSTYDSFGQLKTAKNARGFATTTEYDFLGRPTKVTRPDSTTISTTYTAMGQPRQVTDARGIITKYDYDPVLHHLISVTAAQGDAKSRTTAFGYDSADRVNQVTAPNGQVTDSVFDALGRLTNRSSTLDADGTKYAESFSYYQTDELKVHHDIQGDVVHTYDALGHLTTVTDPLNQVTQTEYDSEGNLIKMTDASNHVTKYTYDELGRLTVTTLPQGATETNDYDGYRLNKHTLAPTTGVGPPVVTDFDYDALDRVTKTTRHLSPTNVVESRVYDGEGNLTNTTDAAGNSTSFEYNSLNQLTLVTHPDTSTEAFTYDGQGNRRTHTHLPIADDRTYTYTPHGEIESVADALGHTTSFTYDEGGNLYTTADPLGRITVNEYDLANRLGKVTRPGNRISTFKYDTVGNRVAVTDAANRTRRYEYDSLGRLKRALTPLYNALSSIAANHSDPSGSVVDIAGQKFAASQLTYDPVGNLETLTDPNNHKTTFKYDSGNRLTHTYLPANPSVAHEIDAYDFAGRRATRTDAEGATTTYGYDALSRLTSVQPPSAHIGVPVSYAYDPRGLRSSMIDGLGTTNYTYDNRGRLHTEQTPYAGSLVYTHDSLGRLTNLHSTNVGGTNTTYSYDDTSRLTTVFDALRSETTTYDYNDDDQLARVTQPNGTVTNQSYDNAGRPDVTTTSRGFSTLFSQQYTYMPVDQVDTVTTTISRPTPFLPLQNGVGYTYDSSDRLLRETHAGDTINGQIDYTLDPTGNRTARTSTIAGVGAQSFVYDPNNALASLFTYDARGNPTAGPLFPGTFSDTYDYLDQHVSRTGNVEYLYDGDGRRVGHRAFDSVSGRWINHTRLISSLNPTGYEQDVEEFTDGVMSSSYTIGHGRLAGQRFVDEATTALGLTIALGADGKVYVWGNGQTTPTAVPGLSGIIAVGAGASHYLALGADGKVYSWGTSNASGQLGRSGDIATPAAISGLSNVAAISTQLDHTLALTTDGTVYTWGDNSSGQLGDGTTTNRNAPVAVATGAISIAAGQVHSYAVMVDGTAEAWGDNTYGQIGQGSVSRLLTPTAIPGLAGVSELAAGGFHALVLKSDGTLLTWGDNSFGQLGDPAVVPSRATPTPIGGISGLAAIAAGTRHSLALQADGTLLAWGENRSGQLGVSYPADIYTPTPVPGLNNLAHVAAGARSSYATTASGATYVMGANRNGQLGTGNTASSTTPQILPSGTNPAFAALASGGESGPKSTAHAVGLRDQFFAPDLHGHTRLLTDVAGTATQTYSYDAFGNLLNATDSSGYSLPATRYPLLTATNPYLYRGERLEAETGRYHLRARDYDASLGRLTTLDTYVGDPASPLSLNRYAYTEANPVGNADPTGHFSLSVWELLGQMDEINRQWDEIASVGRQEEFDPEQAFNNFRNAIAGIPSSPLTITKKERAIWMNASRQGGLIGSLVDGSAQGSYEETSIDSAGKETTKKITKGYAAGSDVFFHTNTNPRHRLSTIERTVEQAWASAYNLRHTINIGLPVTSTDAKAWQTRWPANLYHDAMLQAQLRSQMIEGPVEARFSLSLNRKLYNHSRVTLTASAVRNLSGAQTGGLLTWQAPDQSGASGIDSSFLRSLRTTGFEGSSQYELFREGYQIGYRQASPGIGTFAAGAVLAFVPGSGSVGTGVSGMILSGVRTGLIYTGTKQVVNLAVGAQKELDFKEAALEVTSIAAFEFGFRALPAVTDRLLDLPVSQLVGQAARLGRRVTSRTINIADNFAQDARALARGGIKGAGKWQGQVNMGVDPTPVVRGAIEELRLARGARAIRNQAERMLIEELPSISAAGSGVGTQMEFNFSSASEGRTLNATVATEPLGTRILFGQRRVGPRFSDKKGVPKYLAGRLISDVAEDLRLGKLNADQLPINAFRGQNDELISINTRTFAALSEAGLYPTRINIVKPTRNELLRLREKTIINSPLPSRSVPVTPTMIDLTVMRVITAP